MRRGEESERGKKRGCDLPEEKKEVELVERERERERDREWECCVGFILIFWVCVCLILCLFFEKNKLKMSIKENVLLVFCV